MGAKAKGSKLTGTKTMAARTAATDARKSENRKTRYTKAVLRDALTDLLQEQPIDKVTVTSICKLADVSRGTFYLHYRDAYDLLETIEDEFLATLEQQFLEKVEGLDELGYSQDHDFWLDALNQILKAKELTRLLFANPQGSFMTKCLALNRSYADRLCQQLYPELSEHERSYMHIFYEYGSASVIGEWVRSSFPEPPEQLAALLGRLNRNKGG
jgi:AcrR family transcriptional regulator